MNILKHSRVMVMGLVASLGCIVAQPASAVSLPDLGLSIPAGHTDVNAFNLKVTYIANPDVPGFGLLTIVNDGVNTANPLRGQSVTLDASASVAQHTFSTIGKFALQISLAHDASGVTVLGGTLNVESDLRPSDGSTSPSLIDYVPTTVLHATQFTGFGGADSHLDLTWIQDLDVTSPIDLADVRAGSRGGAILLVGDLFNNAGNIVRDNTGGSPGAWDVDLFASDFFNFNPTLTSGRASVGKADTFVPEPTAAAMTGAFALAGLALRRQRKNGHASI